MEKEIKGIECKFAVHIPAKTPDLHDIHLIKERVHFTDNTYESRITLLKDFKRPFWVEKQSSRNYKQKKEYRHIDNLIKYESTQTDLKDNIERALGGKFVNNNNNSKRPKSFRDLLSSPYIYGADILSTSIIKHIYKNKYKDCESLYSVAGFDIETDVVNGTGDVVMASIVFEDKVFISVDKNFVKGITDLDFLFQKLCKKYLDKELNKYKLNIELQLAEDPVDCIRGCFNKAHEWKPDFLEIWNIDFDIPKILELFKKYRVDPRDILCDPSVPKEYRLCKYKKGMQKKETASGKFKPIKNAAQWHTLFLSASFYVIDGMCSYKQIRLMSEQDQPSYSLDNILKKEGLDGKLTFEEAKDYEDSKLKWHIFMQTYHKIEYMIYNIFDSLRMLELDFKTKDLAASLPNFASNTDFSKFNSQPSKIADAFFYFIFKKGYVLGSVGNKPEAEIRDEDLVDDEDEITPENHDILSLRDWIVTLPASLIMLGLPLIKEDSSIRTNIRFFVFDSDEVSAYPSATMVLNVSKETTLRELISIDGKEEDVFRIQNLNFVIGYSNSLEYVVNMFDAPKPQDLLNIFDDV